MRTERLELSQENLPDPKSGASTNFATSAGKNEMGRILDSSAVERSAVNRLAVGSNPTRGEREEERENVNKDINKDRSSNKFIVNDSTSECIDKCHTRIDDSE